MKLSFTPAAARAGLILAVALLLAGPASAATILIDSVAHLPTSLAGFPTTVAITPHPLWQPNHPVNPGDAQDTSAVWISYDDTGYGGAHFQPFMGTVPMVSIYRRFISAAGDLVLKVWADDSADVKLDGSLLKRAVFTQSTCSGQPIGCRPQDYALINAPLTAGSHTLEFVLYQVGTGGDATSNPMGLLFTGAAPAPVPEPALLSLVGVGLVGLGLVRRRRRHSD